MNIPLRAVTWWTVGGVLRRFQEREAQTMTERDEEREREREGGRGCAGLRV